MKKLYLIVFATIFSVSANAQDVLKVTADQKSVTADQAGDYDRIEDNWQMQAGTMYLITMPAQLDGYYFGPDAKRMNVVSYEKKDDGYYVVSTGEMDDSDDFQANKSYLVTPSVAMDKICHLTGGIKTSVSATPEGKELLHSEVKEVVTGISGLQNSETQKPSTIYDLQGRPVGTVIKGETYIINGKKVIIK